MKKGIVLGALVGLILVVVVGLYLMGNARLNKKYTFQPSNIALPTDAARIEYGKHRAESLCEGCHGKDLSGIDHWFNAGPLGTIDSGLILKANRFLCRRFYPRLI